MLLLQCVFSEFLEKSAEIYQSILQTQRSPHIDVTLAVCVFRVPREERRDLPVDPADPAQSSSHIDVTLAVCVFRVP